MKKRLSVVLLSLLFILSSFMTITAFAASPASQDGLTAALTSSKAAYAANEDIDLSLMVTNNNAYATDGIQTAITLPNGMTVKSGSLAQNAFSLAAGESKTNSATAIKNATVTPVEKPNDTNSPQTGDISSIAVWLTLMLISAGALAFFAIKNKKINSKSMLSLFICFTLLGTAGLPISANAASTKKSFTVTEDLSVDGKAVTISAEISYGYAAHNTVTVTNGTGSAVYAEGDTVTITADTAPVGKHFTSWTVVSGGVALADSGKENTTFTMPNKAVEVTANYEANTYTITASTDSNGAVSPAGAIAVKHGENETFTITPNEGYHIVDVLVDGTSVGAVAEYTFIDVVSGGHTISAAFAKDTYLVTVNNGTVQGGKTTIAWGETVTVTAQTPVGKKFVSWSVDSNNMTLGDENGETASFIMPRASVTLTASFVKLPNETLADPDSFYQVPDGKAMIIFEDSLYDQYAMIDEGEYYLDFETVNGMLDRRFYWSESDKLLTFTNPTELIRAAAGSCDYYVNKSKVTDDNPVIKLINGKPYVSLTFVKKYADITAATYLHPNRIVIKYAWDKAYMTAQITDATQLRTQATDQGEILAQLAAGETVTFVNGAAAENGYAKVMTETGLIGFAAVAKLSAAVEKSDSSPNQKTVYTNIKKDYSILAGYHAVKNQDDNSKLLSVVENTKGLNTICPSWLSAASGGSLVSLASDNYTARAHNADIEVWAQLTDSGLGADINTVLSDTAARDKLINEIIGNEVKYDMNGIVVQFDHISSAGVSAYMQFIRELSVKCRNNGIVLVIDLSVPADAMSIADKNETAEIVDYCIYNTYIPINTLQEAGSASSLKQTEQALTEILKTVPNEKLLAGITFSSSYWEITGQGDTQTVQASYLNSLKVASFLSQYNLTAALDESTGQNYAGCTSGDTVYKLWIEDAYSIDAKMKIIFKDQCAGIVCNTLGDESSNVWNVILKYVN